MADFETSTSIPEFFKGRDVFMTGGTGFVGKCLIEKLLRSCPEVGTIYVLTRPKKGVPAEERLKVFTDCPMYETVENRRPGVLAKKLKIVEGDVMQLELGISAADRATLIKNVSIVFHCAASVRFDDSLKTAAIMNTRGTREVCELALRMEKLAVFTHVSTAYSNADKNVVLEELHPPHADWRRTIDLAEKIDEHTLQILTEKYMGGMPNTYTFTKSLAEHVVGDLCRNKIPTVILRPSIVISSIIEPIPGWIDNFNGPVGLLVASGKGVVRTTCANPDVIPDYMPVDMAVRSILMATWQKGTTSNIKDKLELSVYNCSSHGYNDVTMGKMIQMAQELKWECPMSSVLWYPGGGITRYKTWNYIRVIFLHLLPAVVVDAILKLLKRKPMLIKIQRKIFIANSALDYFITKEWTFVNEKFDSLERRLLPNDVESFRYIKDVDRFKYFANAMRVAKKYLLKEDMSNLDKDKNNLYRMYILDVLVRYSFYGATTWFLYRKVQILTIAYNIWMVCFRPMYEDA